MLAAACLTTPIFADEPVKALPAVNFFEYLADMQKIEGEWVSPVDLLDKNIDLALPPSVATTAGQPLKKDATSNVVDKPAPIKTQEKKL
ncbi:hypothetical protein [uncultured Paraglaciecola sp.]|jgi:hypothetical protein|uniref:hypothetical protein n=1 Tax=uncultured Paraglaciecola sp. TaxID=1765024 RepID=UPI0025F56A65|nr:hypothetical protein [uncultured Paraglaciecola sp.]